MITILYVYKKNNFYDEHILTYFLKKCYNHPKVKIHLVTNDDTPYIPPFIARNSINADIQLDNTIIGPHTNDWLENAETNKNEILQLFTKVPDEIYDIFPHTYFNTIPSFSVSPYNGTHIFTDIKCIIKGVKIYSQNLFLDKYLESIKPKYSFFIPYYDEPVLEKYSIYHTFIHPVQLKPPSVYFESEIFRRIKEIPNTEYIGILTWRSERKIQRKLNELIFDLNSLRKEYDLIALYPREDSKELLEYAYTSHGNNFKILWEWLLSELKIPIEPITFTFYSNLWIMKRTFFVEYIDFVNKCMKILDTIPPELNKILWSNSNYSAGSLSSEQLMSRFNLPHYSFHPFIFERLICLFCHNKKLYRFLMQKKYI